MLDTILSLLSDCLSCALNIFQQFMDATGMSGLFIACFGIFTVVSLLIIPLRGARVITLSQDESKNRKRSRRSSDE